MITNMCIYASQTPTQIGTFYWNDRQILARKIELEKQVTSHLKPQRKNPEYYSHTTATKKEHSYLKPTVGWTLKRNMKQPFIMFIV